MEWITAILLVVGVGMAGVMKLMGHPMAAEISARLDYENLRMPIGGAEVLGAIGILIGAISSQDWEWVGVLAGLGVIGLMIGAIVYHRRAGDEPKEMAPAAVILVLAVLYVIALFTN